MSITRRLPTLTGLTAAVPIGGSVPASAAFSQAVAGPSTAGTTSVAPPGSGTHVTATSVPTRSLPC